MSRPGPWTSPSVEVAETLRQADELSRGIIEAAAPLRFALAESPAEREAIYRQRYEVIVERGWARPEEFAAPREVDAFDERAIHIAAWDGDVLAASSRIVLPVPRTQLPTEVTFGVPVEPAGEVVDMGRQIVARGYSSIQHQVFAALLARTWLEMHALGYARVCGDFTPSVTRLYRLMGFQVETIGPARPFWGEERFPIIVDIVGSVPALLKRWGRMAGKSL